MSLALLEIATFAPDKQTVNNHNPDILIYLTHMHKQCESMEWRKRWAGQAAVYRTFSTNHLSYTKTLVTIYIFRAITFFDGAAIFGKKMAFLPQNKKTLLWAVFREALIVAPPFLDMCLDIYGAWIRHYFRKYSIFGKKWVFKIKTFLCHGPNIHHQAFSIN